MSVAESPVVVRGHPLAGLLGQEGEVVRGQRVGAGGRGRDRALRAPERGTVPDLQHGGVGSTRQRNGGV